MVLVRRGTGASDANNDGNGTSLVLRLPLVTSDVMLVAVATTGNLVDSVADSTGSTYALIGRDTVSPSQLNVEFWTASVAGTDPNGSLTITLAAPARFAAVAFGAIGIVSTTSTIINDNNVDISNNPEIGTVAVTSFFVMAVGANNAVKFGRATGSPPVDIQGSTDGGGSDASVAIIHSTKKVGTKGLAVGLAPKLGQRWSAIARSVQDAAQPPPFPTIISLFFEPAYGPLPRQVLRLK